LKSVQEFQYLFISLGIEGKNIASFGHKKYFKYQSFADLRGLILTQAGLFRGNKLSTHQDM